MMDKFSKWGYYLAIIGVIILWQLLKNGFNGLFLGKSVGENDSNLPKPMAKALIQITNDLEENESFINGINNLFRDFGLSPKLVEEIMKLPEMESTLIPFKNKQDIDFELLKLELIKAYTTGMEEEAKERGITADMSIDEQNRRWFS
jgi:hypothetical protein